MRDDAVTGNGRAGSARAGHAGTGNAGTGNAGAGETAPVMHGLACRAREAAAVLAQAPAGQRTEALRHVAAGLREGVAAVLAANRDDVTQAGLSPDTGQRLAMSAGTIGVMAESVERLAEMPDPVGQCLEEWQRPNGLRIRRMAIPFGVLGMLCEGRPGIGLEAAALAIRSGNALLLRGAPEGFHSARALHHVVRQGLVRAGLPGDAVMIAPDRGPEHVGAMLSAAGLIDMVVARGGQALLAQVRAEARMPVLAHAAGLCHSYVHAAADPALARKVIRNAKLRRPGICGATETLLMDAAIAPSLLPRIVEDLAAEGCRFRADAAARSILPELPAATEADFATEWRDRMLNIAVVRDVDEALAHIRRFSSCHTEAILTGDEAVARYFMARVPSAVVMWNSPTQFSDGGELGLGGEIAIVAAPTVPRGPVGPAQLMTWRYEVHGTGQTRA